MTAIKQINVLLTDAQRLYIVNHQKLKACFTFGDWQQFSPCRRSLLRDTSFIYHLRAMYRVAKKSAVVLRKDVFSI